MTAILNPITVDHLDRLRKNHPGFSVLIARGTMTDSNVQHIAYTKLYDGETLTYLQRTYGEEDLTAVLLRVTSRALEEAKTHLSLNGLRDLLDMPRSNFPGFVFIGRGEAVRSVYDHLTAFFQLGASQLHLGHMHGDEIDHRTKIARSKLQGFEQFRDINALRSALCNPPCGFPTLQELLINKHDGPEENPPVFYQNGLVGLTPSTKARILQEMTPDWVVLAVRLNVKMIARKYGDNAVKYAAAKALSPNGVFYIATHRDKLPMSRMFLANQASEDVLNDSSLTSEEVMEIPAGFFDLVGRPTHEIITGFTVHHYNSMGFVSRKVKKNALAERGNQIELQLFVEKRPGHGSLRNSTAIFAFTNGNVTRPMQIDQSAIIPEHELNLETTLLKSLGEIVEKTPVKVTVTVSESSEGRAKNVDTPLGILKEFQGVWSATNARTYLEFKQPEESATR